MMLEKSGFKLWYTRNNETRSGVGVIMDDSLKDEVVDVIRKEDRIIGLNLVFEKEKINIISVYAPQVGLEEAVKV